MQIRYFNLHIFARQSPILPSTKFHHHRPCGSWDLTVDGRTELQKKWLLSLFLNIVQARQKRAPSQGGGKQVCTGGKNKKMLRLARIIYQIIRLVTRIKNMYSLPYLQLIVLRYLWKCTKIVIFRTFRLYRGKKCKLLQICQKWAHIVRWVIRIKTRNCLHPLRLLVSNKPSKTMDSRSFDLILPVSS
jgi:hypothetical protein